MGTGFLKKCRTFLFDLDGTIYCGSKPMPGAAQLLSALRARGCAVRFVSNNSSHAVGFVREKLKRMGIESEIEDIITPLSTSGAFIRGAFGKSRVFVLGTRALASSVTGAGHQLAEGSGRCDAVVIGRDIEITYQKIERACIFLQRGAACVVCNSDSTHPGESGYLVPETGAFYAMVKTVCKPGVWLEIGKPDPFLFTCAMAGASPESCVMVGDNIDTDIAGAQRAGCRTVLLKGPLSGGREACADLCVEGLASLLELVK